MRLTFLLLALLLTGCATVSPPLTRHQLDAAQHREAVEDSTALAQQRAVALAAWTEPDLWFNIMLTFTAPGDSTSTGGYRACSHYVIRRTHANGLIDTVQALRWLSPTNHMLVPAIPRTPGTPDTIFVPYDSTSLWRQGGISFDLAAEDGAGNRAAHWSNRVQVIVSPFLPDTAYHFAGPRMPRDSTWWKWGYQDGTFARTVSWSRVAGDTVGAARILHQELVQREHWQDVRRHFGYVVVRGVRDSSEAAP